jgi:hypothetical protein
LENYLPRDTQKRRKQVVFVEVARGAMASRGEAAVKVALRKRGPPTGGGPCTIRGSVKGSRNNVEVVYTEVLLGESAKKIFSCVVVVLA